MAREATETARALDAQGSNPAFLLGEEWEDWILTARTNERFARSWTQDVRRGLCQLRRFHVTGRRLPARSSWPGRESIF